MSSDRVHFETPENVEVGYQLAGVGTRFVAWIFDSILLWLFTFLALLGLFLLGAASERIFRQLTAPLKDVGPADSAEILLYFIGLFTLIFGLGSFVYYALFELWMRGQTPGKRSVGIRVVKADGFSLDPGSVVLRNIFRIVDQLPLLWIVPVLSARQQRFGDMVAGTLVVADSTETIAPLRESLAERPAAEVRFRFEPSALRHLRPVDFQAVERLLERWSDLDASLRAQLAAQIITALAQRLTMDAPPDEAGQLQFLEDLMAAEYRRQDRRLS